MIERAATLLLLGLTCFTVVACSSSTGETGDGDATPGTDTIAESIVPEEVTTPADAAMDDASPDAGDTHEVELPPPVLSLTCPDPGPLPFETESDGFLDEASASLVADNPFHMGENLDVLTTPEGAQDISGRFVFGMSGLTGTPLVGEWVSIWRVSGAGQWEQVDRLLTDEEGRYSVALEGDERFPVGTHRLYAIIEGSGTCAVHTVAIYPAGTQMVVSDIDGTLTLGNAELVMEVADPTYDQKEMGAAQELMGAWASKQYVPVYITARPATYHEISRIWLDAHGFPPGAVITAEATVVSDEDTLAYKRGQLELMLDTYGWFVVAAYGNATTDIGAYAEAGIPKDVTFIVGPEGGTEGTVAIEDLDFGYHIESYVDALDDAVQPF